MKKHLIIFILLCKLSYGQSTDSIPNHQLCIIGGLQISNHINGGLFYKGDSYNEKNNYYNKILSLPMLYISLGAKYKNIFQVVDYAYNARKGFYQLDLGSDNIKVNYFAYHVWYDFLNKKKFPIKPMLSINLAYVEKKYEFFASIDNGGYTSSWDFKDFSKTFFIQMPVGIYLDYKNVCVSLTYNLQVFGWIKGSIQDKQIVSGNYPWSQFTSNNYSGNSSNTNFEKQNNIFSMRLAYIFKL